MWNGQEGDKAVVLRTQKLELPGGRRGSSSEFPSVAELKIKVIKLEEETARKPVPALLALHGTT